jgi:hypothetical protein
MSKKYPRPDHAVSLWTEGDELFVDFDSHTVRIPLAKCSIECSSFGSPLSRQLGWNTLLTVLRDRERADRKPTIAKEGSPVQYDVEQMIKTFKAKRAKTMLIGGIEFTNAELLDLMRELK